MKYAEYSERLNRLGKRYWQDGIQTVSDYVRAVGDLSKREQSADSLLQFAQNEGVDFAKRLYQCNADYYTDVFTMGLGLSQQKVQAATGEQQTVASPCSEGSMTASAAPVSASAPASTAALHTELHFNGAIGDTVSEAFVIANHQPEAIDISFEVSEFVSEGQQKVRLPVTITPAPVTLEQQQEQVMQCQIQLSDELIAGQRYQAIARVVGYSQMMVRLVLDISEPDT